jgi:hypothetical protein
MGTDQAQGIDSFVPSYQGNTLFTEDKGTIKRNVGQRDIDNNLALQGPWPEKLPESRK